MAEAHNEMVTIKMFLCEREMKQIKEEIKILRDHRDEYMCCLLAHYNNISQEEIEETEAFCDRKSAEIAKLEQKLREAQQRHRYLIWDFLPTDTPFKRQH